LTGRLDGQPALEEERMARIRLSRVAEPGDPDVCRLVRDHSATAVVERLRDGHVQQPKVQAWAGRLAAAEPDAIMSAAQAVSARFVIPGDADWPPELSDLTSLEGADGDRRAGAPLGLWVRGSLPLGGLGLRAVAVVGARACTDYGTHVAGSLAAGCAAAGWSVVSGGAYGIDAAAHRGALSAQRPTVAVLASGIDRPYPVGHRELLEAVASTGLLISEAAPGCPPSRSRFLVRNRLIAALGRGTVVVEAALRSGSLNTARWAGDLNRAVMGVPGPVTSMMSTGVHQLLRQPETVLVTDADEVLELVAPLGDVATPLKQGQILPRDRLDAASRRLLEAVPRVAPAPVASIAAHAGLAPADAVARLVALADGGLVIGVGGYWRLPPSTPDAP